MSNAFTILIADRNRHVREFLQRELRAEGYRVQVARDGREVLLMVKGDEPPDLLILDLEMPYGDGLTILEQIRHHKPPLPIIIHSFLTDYANHPDVADTAAFVEKSGNTDSLKAAVLEVLHSHYPTRFIQHEEDVLPGR